MKRKVHHILYIVTILCSLCAFSWFYLRTPRTTAQSAGASVTVAAACSFTGTINSAHTASIPAGTYKQNIGETTFKTVCNDPYGYSVYAIGYTNNEWGNTKLLATIGGTLTPTSDIATGTATSGSTSNWAMKVTAVTSTSTPTIENGYTNYSNIPATATKVASFPSVTDRTNGSSIKATYAAFIATAQPAGNYDGKVKFLMVHPATDTPLEPITCDAGKICYAPNARGVADSMGDQTASSNSETMLWPSNFKRDGYGFAGWNTEFDYSGITYGPMETITTPDLSTEGLALYAYWVKSAGELQGWQGCPSLAQGDVTALTDTRDNNTYAVAKLADGKCWMIENLRLGGATAMNLTTSNTAIASDITLPASTNTFTTSNYTTIEMSAKNTLETVSDMTTPTNAEVYSYGNYYSWPAAIGSTTAYSTNNQSVNTSICPSGWHLPKGGDKNNTSNSEFWKLIVTDLNNGTNPADYSSSTYPYYTGDPEGTNVSKLVRSYPNNFLYSGSLGGSSFNSRGSGGLYWSSTVYYSNNSYYLIFNSSTVYPGTNFSVSKYVGFSVRCVADDPPATISDAYAKAGKTKQNGYYKMQDMDDNICGMVNVLDEPGQTQLIDTRDNKVYWATKLKDGKCWMTQNLDHDISTTFAYTPDNTDIPANWTPDKSTYATGTTTWNTSSTGYNIQQSYDPGDKIWDGTPNSTSLTLDTMTQGTNPHYHIGNYYSWSAAVAMNNTASYTTQYTDVNQSICPKGWTLPKSGNITTAGSFRYLVNQYNWSSNQMTNPNIWQAPLYFPLAGSWYGSSNNVAYYGDFWSSVVYSPNYAYYLSEDYNGHVYPVDTSGRNRGISIRCVSR